jgi:hypothetical protein
MAKPCVFPRAKSTNAMYILWLREGPFQLIKILWESASRSLFTSFTKLVLGWLPLLNACSAK